MFDVLAAGIGSAAIAAILAFLFNRNLADAAAWRKLKLEYYQELVDSIAMNVEGDDTKKIHREFARASNNLLLVAPREVLRTHHEFRDHIKVSNSARDYSRDKRLLADLLRAMRKDIRMPSANDLDERYVQLWSSKSGPPRSSSATKA